MTRAPIKPNTPVDFQSLSDQLPQEETMARGSSGDKTYAPLCPDGETKQTSAAKRSTQRPEGELATQGPASSEAVSLRCRHHSPKAGKALHSPWFTIGGVGFGTWYDVAPSSAIDRHRGCASQTASKSHRWASMTRAAARCTTRIRHPGGLGGGWWWAKLRDSSSWSASGASHRGRGG
jgi:hypothetical protein